MLSIEANYYKMGWLGKPMQKGLKSQPILYKAFMEGRKDKKNGVSKFKEGYDPYTNTFKQPLK